MPLTAKLLGLALLAAIVLLYAFRPEAPWPLQRLLGLAIVGLLVLVYVLATARVETPEELMLRLRRGQSAEFGKRLREVAHEQHRSVRLPMVGEVRLRTLGAVFVGLVGLGWWLSPLAPVAISKPTIEDIASRLADEIKAAILVRVGETLVLPQPPIVPGRVRELAVWITDESDRYQWALKATAESRFDDARRLLVMAAKGEDAELEKIRLARAINEMYAARFREAAASYEELIDLRPDDTGLLCQAAVARAQAGEFGEAQSLIERAVGICREKLGPDDEAWAPVLHARAMLLLLRGGALEEAHKAAGRSRDIWIKTLGPDHRFVTASRNNQAAIHAAQGKFSGAEELYNWARESWSKGLGETHPYVASALDNLAQVRAAAGAYGEARDLLQRAFEIRDTAVEDLTLPANHPILALGYNPLARLHVTMAEYQAAEPMALRAVEIAEATLGPEHPLVGAGRETLGALYTAQARYARAKPAYSLSVVIQEKTWGVEHPAVAGPLCGLAELYMKQQTYGVQPLDPGLDGIVARVQAIFEKSYGKEHPRTAAVLLLRGRLEAARDRPRESRLALDEARDILTESYGKEHPDIARIRGYLAALSDSPSPTVNQRGVREYEQAISMAVEFFGEEHPELARLWFGLAKLHVTGGRLSEAQRALERALEIRQKTLTPCHPALAITYSAYAKVLEESDPPATEAAERMRAKAQEILALFEEENRPE
jgi:tetratricopeptide (TPR) repeat protein